MFERYTEQARRTIFFARYEASQLRTDRIEPIHLLLGLLREDLTLRQMLSSPQREEIREHAERNFMGTNDVTTSIDLPLSHSCKRALDRARDVADETPRGPIDSTHLVLGLLRIGDDSLQVLLRQYGVDEPAIRQRMEGRRTPPRAPGAIRLERRFTSALEQISEEASSERLKRLPWTRRQALGHLIDWAAAHHEWIGRALVDKKVAAYGYPLEERVEAAKYEEMRWADLVIVWIAMNDLLGQIVARIPPERLETPCRIGIAPEKPLRNVIERYREYTEDMLAQICAMGGML
jgi:ATP-dependent Clp protease ATP-binding subunit ClpA